MRVALIAGLLLIGAGAYVFLNGGSFSTQRDVVKVGDLKITASEERPVAPWLAGAAVVAGIVLIGASVRQKS